MTITVADVMQSPALVVGEQETLEHVDALLQRTSVSAMPVAGAGGDLVGVISRSDLLHHALGLRTLAKARTLILPDVAAREAMSTRLLKVSPGDALAAAASLMATQRVHRVFATEGRRVVGVVATLDVMRAVARQQLSAPIREWMTAPVLTVPVTDSMKRAVEILGDVNKHGLVALRDGVPVGVLTLEDVLCARQWPPSAMVEDWMSPGMLCLPQNMSLGRAAAHALAWDVRHAVVMDDAGMVGLITGADFTRAYAALGVRP